MKKILFILSIIATELSISLIVTMSFIRYEIDKLDGAYITNIYSYMPDTLIFWIFVIFLVEIFIIWKK